MTVESKYEARCGIVDKKTGETLLMIPPHFMPGVPHDADKPEKWEDGTACPLCGKPINGSGCSDIFEIEVDGTQRDIDWLTGGRLDSLGWGTYECTGCDWYGEPEWYEDKEWDEGIWYLFKLGLMELLDREQAENNKQCQIIMAKPCQKCNKPFAKGDTRCWRGNGGPWCEQCYERPSWA